ncbi:MAG: cell division protein SepF [Methanomicrobiales archaeon]|jgi:SepF-like predicted cell division protein (DUF552 family)|nr:cell division protein SepF [Methanomicrobiales archaeon]
MRLWPFSKNPNEETSAEDYKDLDIGTYESSDRPALLIKIATVTDLKGTQNIKNQIYDGHIVVVDISRLKQDKITFERVMKDFKQVSSDVGGDIVGLGDQQYVIISPRNVKISRDRIGGP